MLGVCLRVRACTVSEPSRPQRAGQEGPSSVCVSSTVGVLVPQGN